jgi:type III restriction enzyme
LDDRIVMLEANARNQMESPEVLAKQAAAVTWCHHASEHALAHGGKRWSYALIPHDAIGENWHLSDLRKRWTVAESPIAAPADRLSQPNLTS